MKKVLALVLAIAMILSMAACSGGGSGKNNTSGSGSANTDDGFDMNSVTYDENGFALRGYTLPIADDLTLQMFMETDVKWSATHNSVSELASYQIIMEKTGINVEFIHPAAGQQTEQLNLLMASKGLPDMVFYTWRSITGGPAKYIEEGQIIALNDYMKYAPNYSYLLEKYPNAKKDTVLDDGTIYMFDMLRINDKTGGWFILNGISGRQDWLDKLGLAMPTTVQEFEDAMIAIRDNDPNGNGQKDEIPLSFTKDGAGTFAGWYGVQTNFYVKDGKIHFGQLEDGYKEYLQLMNKWYSEGLLDNEYLLNDSAALNTKVSSSQVAFAYGALAGGMGTWTNMLAETDPSANVQPVPYFPAADGKQYLNYRFNESGTASGVAISGNCKNVKEAVMFRDFFYSEQGILISDFGKEGESYTFVDGKPIFTDAVLHNDKGLTTTQALSYYVLSAANDGMVKSGDYFEQVTLLLDNQKKSQEVWATATDELVIPGGVAFTTEESSEYADLYSTIKTYSDEMIAKFISGQESFDKYDEFIENLKNYKVERCIELYQAAYDRYTKR